MTFLVFLSCFSFVWSHRVDPVNLTKPPIDPAVHQPTTTTTASSSNTCLSVSTTSGGADHTAPFCSDQDLMKLVDKHVMTDRLLDAARLLERIQNKSLLQKQHVAVVDKAETIKKNVADHDHRFWNKQFESHRRHDTRISFRRHAAGGTSRRNRLLTTRMEAAIEPSLVIPLLSVLGESELYNTWMPRFEKPFKPGLKSAVKLRQYSSHSPSQLVSLKIELPWPMWTREMLLDVRVCDDIDSTEQIMINLQSLKSGESLPPVEHGVMRVDFNGGLLLRKCPLDHPTIVNSKRPLSSKQNLVLVSMTVTSVPGIVAGWTVYRVAWGRVWSKLLQVAEGVRDGKRLGHTAAIRQKREMYDRVEDRVGVMLRSSAESNGN